MAYNMSMLPTTMSLDDTVMQTQDFRISSEYDQAPFPDPEMYHAMNNGHKTWHAAITAALRAVDRHLQTLRTAAATGTANPESLAEASEFMAPAGWISHCPHEPIEFERCGTMKLFFTSDDTCQEPHEFYHKYCRGDNQPLVLSFDYHQMFAKLERAEKNREAAVNGELLSIGSDEKSDDPPPRLHASGDFPIQRHRYHIIPLDIQLNTFVNKTPVPLGIQLETIMPGSTDARKWIVDNGQSNARSARDGSYGVSVPAQYTVDRPSVVFRADHSHMNAGDFRIWGTFPTEELEQQLSKYERLDTYGYNVPAPHEDAKHFPDALMYMILRYYPKMYFKAKLADPGAYAHLTPESWYNREKGIINVPKHEATRIIQQIRRTQNLGLNMMCCDEIKLTCTPLNTSGWGLLPRIYDNFDSTAYRAMQAFHPAKHTSVSAEITIRYIPMRRPLPVQL